MNVENQKTNYAVIIKIIVFAMFLIISYAFFGFALKQTFVNYESLLFPSLESLKLTLWIFFSLFFVVIFSGLFTALARPFWVALVGYFISILAMLLFWEVDVFSLIFSFLFFLLILFYLWFVISELNNRIRFSVRPIGQGQKTLLFCLILLISISFGWGYYNDAKQQNFVIPLKYKEVVLDLVSKFSGDIQSQVTGQLQGQIVNKFSGTEGQTSKEIEELLKSQTQSGTSQEMMPFSLKDFTKQIDNFWEDVNKKYQSFTKFIAIGLGFMLFLTLETIISLISWVVPLILAGIFPVLRWLGVIKIIKKTEETQKLSF